ncbi:TetR/AcrR family transcriptional regulator [Nocardioides sp. TF02-7]|uniref:TetR/AcrR family transcriptional regulator n=1 Tax=Nocardioides sp. TF02-7 TaxID=2917724 RepID=UPI001F057798|nr:TetR/AcrR family transcriptional regulator [Nocardioides sp. TF02-7]UMG91064.1 TetR/AcrR family transcriptional regulator [Nocardioides sp. TF02-7]
MGASRLRREERRRQLLDVAEALFVERGLDAVSLEDVARAAGVTRPVVYEHFENKAALFVACVNRAREHWRTLMAEAVAAEETAEGKLRAGIAVFLQVVEEDPGRWRLAANALAFLGGDFAAELEESRRHLIGLVAGLVAEVAPGGTPLATRFAANAIVGIGERVGLWWLEEPGLDREELVECFVGLVWNGLGPLTR